jgi:poly(A) polymerase
MKLEILETIKLAHPFNKGFDIVHFCQTEEEAIRVANGELKAIGNQSGVKTVVTDLKAAQNGEIEKTNEDDSKFKVYTTTYYVGLEINAGNF